MLLCYYVTDTFFKRKKSVDMAIIRKHWIRKKERKKYNLLDYFILLIRLFLAILTQ